MSKKDKEKLPQEPAAPLEEVPAEVLPEEENPLVKELECLAKQGAEQEDKYLRLAAEYDNFRKRSQKEKELAYSGAYADAAIAMLPVYDNLERAMKQESSDEPYKKGVEMTMAGLRETFSKLGIAEIPALNAAFDPLLHSAVMHVEDEAAGENQIVEVFQTGFQMGERVLRFSVVKVAN